MENNTSKNENDNDAKSLLSAVDIKKMDEILQSNFNEFRLAIGLPPDVLSEKAKEYFRKAMEQYAELRLGAVLGSYSEKDMDNAYDKGFKDAMLKYRTDL